MSSTARRGPRSSGSRACPCWRSPRRVRSPAARVPTWCTVPIRLGAPADLAVLAGLADRLVVTHQDLISFHDPAYFPSASAWDGYRELTRRALAAADRVVFFSEHVRSDALAEELVDASRADVVHLGVDHVRGPAIATPHLPPGRRAGGDAEVMLCLGADFAHKNRVFALRARPRAATSSSVAGAAGAGGPARSLRLLARSGARAARRGPRAGRRRGADGRGERGGEGMAAAPGRAGPVSDRARGLRTGALRGGGGRRAVPVGGGHGAGRAAPRGGSWDRGLGCRGHRGPRAGPHA